jgi:hypothetical protein
MCRRRCAHAHAHPWPACTIQGLHRFIAHTTRHQKRGEACYCKRPHDNALPNNVDLIMSYSFCTSTISRFLHWVLSLSNMLYCSALRTGLYEDQWDIQHKHTCSRYCMDADTVNMYCTLAYMETSWTYYSSCSKGESAWIHTEVIPNTMHMITP